MKGTIRLTPAQRNLLNLLENGGQIYRETGTNSFYVRTRDYARLPIRKATLIRLQKLGYIGSDTLTKAGRAALGAVPSAAAPDALAALSRDDEPAPGAAPRSALTDAERETVDRIQTRINFADTWEPGTVGLMLEVKDIKTLLAIIDRLTGSEAK